MNTCKKCGKSIEGDWVDNPCPHCGFDIRNYITDKEDN